MTSSDDDDSGVDPVTFGPRQQELLEGWRTTVQASPTGLGYDFTAPAPKERLDTRLNEFIAEPTKETLAELWQTLHRTTVSYGYILGQWPESLDELARFLDRVRHAKEWNSTWNEPIRSTSWLYELYSRTHDSIPVIDTFTEQYLRRFGIRVDDDFDSQRRGMERFRAGYEETIGHITAETDYTVSLTREIDELFALIHEFSKADLPSILVGQAKPVYEPLIGFEAKSHDGGRIELDIDIIERVVEQYAAGVKAGAYGIDESLPEDQQRHYWCGHFTKKWKHDAADAVSDVLRGEIDGTALEPSNLDRLLAVFNEGHGVIDQPIIEYLLGPQQGWRVWGQFKERTRENEAVAAAVISRFFDYEADYVTGRLELFRWYYENDDSLRTGSLMKLASGLLMLAWPKRYVMYQYQPCKAFFSDVSVNSFEVDTGYNPTEYHRINAAAERIRERLDNQLSREATMCDIQSIFYFWNKNPL
jgi:hypothetical protein